MKARPQNSTTEVAGLNLVNRALTYIFITDRAAVSNVLLNVPPSPICQLFNYTIRTSTTFVYLGKSPFIKVSPT